MTPLRGPVILMDLLLIDASLRLSPDVPDTLLNKNCVCFALQRLASQRWSGLWAHTARRSPSPWAYPLDRWFPDLLSPITPQMSTQIRLQ